MFSQSFINAARQPVRGIDLSGSYGRNVGDGRLTPRGSVSWLDSSQQTTSAQDHFDLAGSIYNPAKINGRVGAVWSEGGFSASARSAEHPSELQALMRNSYAVVC